MKLAVFYHCKLSGEGIPSEDFALSVMCEQMKALTESGLAREANEVHIGVNGDDDMALLASAISPAKSIFHIHGSKAKSEIPTLNVIERWLPEHSDWAVLYHHTKGITHPGMELYERWRRRMENACVINWRKCVKDLEYGMEAVGCHWLTPEKFPGAVTSPFFGGTFWWAKAEYLLQLPDLPEANWQNRFEAESWIGRRRPYPKIVDYHPGWPA